jgi:hypothetical protein
MEIKIMGSPLVTVIGSVYPARAEEIGLKNVVVGEQAAEAIGGALAKHKCRLVAYSDEHWSVDLPIVRGYVAEASAMGDTADLGIEVHYSTSDEPPHFSEQDTSPHLFEFRPDKNQSWASSFYRSLSRVDGVILLGGGHSTYIAGTVALSHRKPVLAIAAFGGAAENIWRELAPESGLLEQSEIDHMAAPKFTSQTANTLVSNLLKQAQRGRDQQKTRDAISRQHYAVRHVYVALPFLILSLAAVPFTWDNPSVPRTWLLTLLLVSPLLAGVSGATARTAFEAVGGHRSEAAPEISRTCGLGGIAGGVAGALFIIAQLVAMSPEITPEIWSKQAGRLVPFAALIGFIGGLTLDAVFRKLAGTSVISDEVLRTLVSGRAMREDDRVPR